MVLQYALCDSYYDVDYYIIVCCRILGRGCGNVLGNYVAWSVGVKVRAWTFCLEDIKLVVVY